jgi:hypothetical protein
MRAWQRNFGVLLIAACLTILGVRAFAVPTNPGDSSVILGANPSFMNGYWTNANGDWYKSVLDSTASTPAAQGKLEVFKASTTTWLQSAVANTALPMGQYGIVATPALTAGGTANAYVAVRGVINALCTTSSAPAIAAGSLLVSDGSGNLTTPATLAAPSSGAATPFGTTGAATVTYLLYARNLVGLDSAASSAVTTTTANATITTVNGVHVAATIPAGTYQVVIARSAGGPSQGVLAIVNVSPSATAIDFYDVGQAGQFTYAAPTVPVAQIPGAVLAVSEGALAASTSTPTSVSVFVGGY